MQPIASPGLASGRCQSRRGVAEQGFASRCRQRLAGSQREFEHVPEVPIARAVVQGRAAGAPMREKTDALAVARFSEQAWSERTNALQAVVEDLESRLVESAESARIYENKLLSAEQELNRLNMSRSVRVAKMLSRIPLLRKVMNSIP